MTRLFIPWVFLALITAQAKGQDSAKPDNIISQVESPRNEPSKDQGSSNSKELLASQSDAQADQVAMKGITPDFWRGSSLTGDWNGGRTWMSDHGVELAGLLKGDGFSNLHGGLERNTTYIQNIDVTVGVDAEKLVGWNGGSLFVHVLWNNGGELSRYVGDAQVVSNIEAAQMTKLYQAWAQQDLWGGSVSVLAGVYDLNSEFYVTQTSALFINSSHGIGKEFSQTGRNGPSIFPNPAAGVRLRVQPVDGLYFQTVVLDGMPGDPANLSRMSIHFNKEDGLLLTAEAGFLPTGQEADNSNVAKLAIGAWKYTSHFDELNGVDENGDPVQCSKNWGVYLLAEKSIYGESESPGQGLNAFARLGYARSCINEFDYHLGVGAVYTGFFQGRDEDQLGFALAVAHNGREFKQAMTLAGLSVKIAEVTVELTYRAQLTPWLVFQPDIQYVINPSTDPGIQDALVIGSRVEVGL